MGAHTTGVPTEIHAIDATQGSLQPIALASARLTVPIAGPANKAAASKSAATKSAAPKPLASLIARSSAGTSMSRTQSSPASSGASITIATVAGGISPKIPLKTRVIQVLAFNNFTEAQIASKVDSPAADVMRVVNVVSF